MSVIDKERIDNALGGFFKENEGGGELPEDDRDFLVKKISGDFLKRCEERDKIIAEFLAQLTDRGEGMIGVNVTRQDVIAFFAYFHNYLSPEEKNNFYRIIDKFPQRSVQLMQKLPGLGGVHKIADYLDILFDLESNQQVCFKAHDT